CHGVSIQFYVQNHLGLRDLWRQPVRYAEYCVSRGPKPGKIPVPLRCKRLDRQARSQVRGGLHPRAGAERGLSGSGRDRVRSHREPDLLPHQPRSTHSGVELPGALRRNQLPDNCHARRKRQFFAEGSAAGIVRHGFLASDAATDRQLRPALGHNVWSVPGFGLYYNDLAQNGWATAFQAVNTPSAFQPCTAPGDPGCLPGAADGGAGVVIDPHYHTPYSLHVSGGVQYAWHKNWTMSADYVHEQGVHGYRRYEYTAGYTLFSPLFPQDPVSQMANVPNLSVFKSDNTSSYNAMMLHVQGNVSHRFNLTANYVLASAKTWGCVLGELWDYVNGVCNPLNPFGPGDYGPSGEDVVSRFTLAGIVYVPGGFQVTTLIQAESARPLTLTTPVDVNGLGDPTNNRAVINGVQTTMDQFRGTPYVQVDLRVTRPFKVAERWQILPFIEFFNLFNRNNPGANYVTDISALPTPVDNLYNATHL